MEEKRFGADTDDIIGKTFTPPGSVTAAEITAHLACQVYAGKGVPLSV